MREIVERHLNKGLTDLVHVDSFLSYIEGEAVLQRMIVTSVDQSVLGGDSTRIELQTKLKRRVAKIQQSRRRPLLGPSPG